MKNSRREYYVIRDIEMCRVLKTLCAPKRLVLVCILCLCSCCVESVQVEMAVGVIAGLNNKFLLRGAYLFVTPEQDKQDLWTKVGRILSKKQIPTVVTGLQEVMAIPIHLPRLPLCVMYSAGMDNTTMLQQSMAHPKVDIPIWLLFLEEDHSLEDFFRDLHVPFNSKFLVAQVAGNDAYLTEVYRVSSRHPLSETNLGVWRDGRLSMQLTNGKENRNDLQDLTMTAAIMNSPPYTSVEEENGAIDLGGSIAPVWKMLEKRLNFSTNYTFSPDGMSGTSIREGVWNGVIGRLQRQEVDVAVSALTITPARSEIVDFSFPIFVTSYRAFIKKPGNLDVDWGNFWAPFEISLWVAVLIIIFCVSVVVEVCHRLNRRFGDGYLEKQQQTFFCDSFLYVFGAFCSQGQDMTLRCMSVRTGFLVAHLTAMVILAAYSAGLISSLTIETPNLPFTNFQEILETSTYKIGVTNSSSGEGVFRYSNSSLMREIYTKLMAPDPGNFPATALEGIRRACSMKFVFVAQVARVKAVIDKAPCRVLDLPATDIDVSLSIAFAKGSPYRSIINKHLQAMRLGGLLHKLQPEDRREAVAGESEIVNIGVKTDFESVNLGDAVPLLTVWCISIVLGMSFLQLEQKARALLTKRSYEPDDVEGYFRRKGIC